jgi:hypothetical protein
MAPAYAAPARDVRVHAAGAAPPRASVALHQPADGAVGLAAARGLAAGSRGRPGIVKIRSHPRHHEAGAGGEPQLVDREA